MSDKLAERHTYMQPAPNSSTPLPVHNQTILLADDDESLRLILSEALHDEGWRVTLAADLPELEQAWAHQDFDLLICDVLMPSGNAVDLLAHLIESKARRGNQPPIIIMSAHNTLTTALRAGELGAFDYIAKPFDLSEFIDLARKALPQPSETEGTPPESQPITQHSQTLQGEDWSDEGLLIGRSAAMQALYRDLSRLVNNELTILIEGESGTGKELVARTIHARSPRRHGPFVPINMAALPSELIESELFGHEKGAFTGAVGKRAGRFTEAKGGTLFLDEIGDMPLAAQTRLLRVLQEGEYRSVGGQVSERSDVRIVSATHKNLAELVRAGQFREDLYYRLNVIPLYVPPLRSRMEDIDVLAQHFLKKNAARTGLSEKEMDSAALKALKAHTWPGNVRELEHFIQRLVALDPADKLTATSVNKALERALSLGPNTHPPLSASMSPNTTHALTQHTHLQQYADDTRARAFSGQVIEMEMQSAANLTDAVYTHLKHYFDSHGDELPPAGLHGRFLAAVEKPLIEHALNATKGNQIKAAALLGINRNTLRKKISELDIAPHSYR